jgi:LmbE family N-acetylglucosaminyl deacetylase
VETNQLTYMFVGAHPDDADIESGGIAILLKQLGHEIVFVSVTDGSAGHQSMTRPELAERRRGETQNVAEHLGITYIVMDTPDGELVADLETRHKLMKVIREHKPDVIIAPRPNDYHPDHRATGQLIQDCSFMLTVPLVCPEVPALEKSPYIFYIQDGFTRPNELRPDVLVDIGPVIDQKMHSLALHQSQVFEWLPFIDHYEDATPSPDGDYLEWMKRHWGDPGRGSRFAGLLDNPEAKYLEVLECCEYGEHITPEIAAQLFPFAKINLSKVGSK